MKTYHTEVRHISVPLWLTGKGRGSVVLLTSVQSPVITMDVFANQQTELAT